ncbi:MAG: PadR family transcriptional regulator [Acidimicrobiia bacterium]
MGLKEGLLCLLVNGDAHGYQLKSELEATTGETWQVNIGQVYTTLQRLERDGLVESTESNGDGRVIYTLTDLGRQGVSKWLAAPVDLAAAGRDEISLKVLMAMVSGASDPRRVVERQRGATMTLLQDFTTLKAGDSNDDLAWQLYLDRLILSAEAELRWLERVEARLDLMPPFEVTNDLTESMDTNPVEVDR